MANPLDEREEVFDRLENLNEHRSRESPSPMPPGTPAKPSRSPAGSTTCAAPEKSRSRSCATATALMQCVAVKSALPEELFETIKNLTQESSIIVTRQDPRRAARAGRLSRWMWRTCEVVQRVPESDPYPITPKEHGIDFLMDHRHLWLRSQRQHAIIRVRHEVIKAVRDYFDSHGFTLVDTPIFTPAACEGTTTLFEVDYFDDDKAYLTQSGQLYNEATAMAFGKVYCFGPTFRAEKSKTRRHLTEFWMVEPEMAYATLEDVKRVAEEMVVFVVGRVLENRREELKRAGARRFQARSRPGAVPAHELRRGGEDPAGEGQRDPVGRRFRRHRRDAAHRRSTGRSWWTASRPRSKRSTSQPDAERPELALGVDVLAPEGYGEIIGGGQRIHDLDLLLQRIEEHHLPREAFDWYIDLRKYGTVPHGGFGMGIERCVAWICGLEHIRETIAFPRMLYRLRP